MFTGLIEEVGEVLRAGDGEFGFMLRIAAERVLEDAAQGCSIAVDGACLTVTGFGAGWFEVGLAPETLARTTLGDARPGDRVNLERALRADARLGGHLVQGHVDAVAEIVDRRRDGESLRLDIGLPREIARQVVRKGYVAVDGASLTVTDVSNDRFSIMLIAYTQSRIALPDKRAGDRVNLESDILGKYAERLMAAHLDAASRRNTEEYSA